MILSAGAGGSKRPGDNNHRFVFKILLKSNAFERRSRREQVAGSGPDPKIIDFELKSF